MVFELPGTTTSLRSGSHPATIIVQPGLDSKEILKA